MKRLLAIFCAILLIFTGITSLEAKPNNKSGKNKYIYQVTLVNKSGKSISSVQVKADTDQDFGKNILKNKTILKNKKKQKIKYNAKNAIMASKEAQSDSQLKTDPMYTIRLTFKSGETSEIHAFPFKDTNKATILVKENVWYVKYRSKSEKKTLTTLEYEKNLIAQKEAEAKAAEQAKQASEQQASQEATQEINLQQQAQTQQSNQTQQAPVVQQQAPAHDTTTTDPNAGCLDDVTDTW